MTPSEFFSRIDLPLLIKQKQALLRIGGTAPPRDQHLLDGLLNMLDAIHDIKDPPER